ncbi:uncharacterized protein KGF55_004311 [Candida pseudojiufengensis]|uniref:uncharacterized protein n=1 Tax=Candida pseudojiufengensis TaxID=497109 RepID=UPI002225AB1C|nr:uncharacterized protein KGF55_004311 [Candida pseudojiufengensis]KAI5960741.1 hypothetical protein KGF55_004311 [Candida pseudojiufengensis]
MANYIVCLCHFCELHGPSIIICTQLTTKDKKQNYLLQSNSKTTNNSCLSCQLILPENVVNLTTTIDDKEFISTQYPTSQKRYAALTKLVMKSLSVETNLDLTKPNFFGDNINGYCINKIFKIYDINSRGLERKYGLILIGDNEIKILQNWDIITLYFNEFINLLQFKINETNEKNYIENENQNNEKYLRRSMIRPKSLIELTNDDQIFVKFHLWAIEVLKDAIR